MKSKAAAVVLTMALVLGAPIMQACGKKGAPRPPEALAPGPVQFLSGKALVDSIVLEWQAPESNASGDPLSDLQRYVVKRSDYLKEEAPDFEELGEILADEVPKPASSTVPAQIRFVDGTVEAGRKYEYIVVGENESGVEGGAVNVVRVTFIGESSIIENYLVDGR